jgi:hypothetical protein
MQDQFKSFTDELQCSFPPSNPKLTLFPSGAAMLDVKIGAEIYVMEYHSDVGVGINRASKATFGWEGYEYPFDNFESAKAFLMSLLQSERNQ